MCMKNVDIVAASSANCRLANMETPSPGGEYLCPPPPLEYHPPTHRTIHCHLTDSLTFATIVYYGLWMARIALYRNTLADPPAPTAPLLATCLPDRPW